jgi:hypothetical protein
MTTNIDVLRGVVHGKTIELENETELPDGQRVQITIQPVSSPDISMSPLAAGEGIRRSAGAWVDDAKALGNYLEWNR